MAEHETKIVSLNYGRDGEIILTAAPVRMRKVGFGGIIQLFPGQSAEGYGQKITMPWTVEYGGRIRRVYCTLISNNGTCWFMADGKKMIVG